MIPALLCGRSPGSFKGLKTIPGLVLWVDASSTEIVKDGGGFPADGDPVTTWSDIGGRGQAFTQVTLANMPTYRTNIIGGNPIIRFDGTDDWMDLSTVLKQYHQYTMFLVAIRSNTGTGFVVADGAPGMVLIFTSGTPVIASGASNNPQVQRPTGVANGSPGVYTALNSFDFGNGFWLNSNGTTSALNPLNTTLQIGARLSGTNSPYAGDIGELVFYSRGLTLSEIKSINNYLCHKWLQPSKAS